MINLSQTSFGLGQVENEVSLRTPSEGAITDHGHGSRSRDIYQAQASAWQWFFISVQKKSAFARNGACCLMVTGQFKANSLNASHGHGHGHGVFILATSSNGLNVQ
jgi:hypothetical protein